MAKIKDLLKSAHTYIVFVDGLSILAMAIASKYFLKTKINPFFLALPALVVVCYEGLANHKKYRRFANPWYWVIAVILATAGIILYHAL